MVHGHCLYPLASAQDIPAGSHMIAVYYDVVTVMPVLTRHFVPESVAPGNDIFRLKLVYHLEESLACLTVLR